MDYPLASVKMITYNHEPYIAQAIEGVLQQQTDFPFELVIGEDCSTDRTREIVFDYHRKHPDIIRVITSEHNVGMHKNENRAIKACRGKYIAFCEGDDYWHHPQKLQKQVDYLEAHPECGLVHSNGVRHIVRENQSMPLYSVDKRREMLNEGNVLRSLILNSYIIATCSVITRKRLIDEIYFSCKYELDEVHPCTDYQLWNEIAYRSQVKYMDESFVVYNILPESAIHTDCIEKIIRFSSCALTLHLHYADKYGGNEALKMKKDIIRRDGRHLLYLACRARKPELAREILKDSRKYDVPLCPLGYLYFFSAQRNIISCLVRASILLSRRCRRSLARMGWLRAMRNRMRK